MNWLIKLGQWIESRRIIRTPEFDAKLKFVMGEILNEVDKKILASTPKTPPTIVKDMTLLEVRLNRIELLVGLKRDPAPQEVPGSARIG